MTVRRWSVIVCVAALFFASCGGGNGGDSSPSSETTTAPTSDVEASEPEPAEPASTATSEPEPAEPDPEPTEPAESADPEPEPAEPEPTATEIPLTASFRGVTESEILIGIGYVDATLFGFNRGDLQAQWQAAVASVNEAGGINGRMLRAVYGSFSPVGATESDAVCVRFTEDEEVFAFVGFTLRNNELCYTSLYDTIAVNAYAATSEAINKSNGLLFSTEATALGLELGAIKAATEAGLLDGRSVFIVVNPEEEGLLAPVREALEATGAEVIGTAVSTVTDNDIPAAEAEQDVFLQRAIADGADTIYGLAGGGLSQAGAIERAGADIPLITTFSGGNVYTTLGTDPGAIDIRVFAPEPLETLQARGAAGIDDCLRRYEQASGNMVNVGVDNPDPDNFLPTVRACRAIELFVAIATAAGPNLTNDSFVAAANSLGSFDMTGAISASLSSGKVGADDSPLIPLVWDAAIGTFVPPS